MTDVREATRELLTDSPDLAGPLEELLAIDEEGPFEFHDIPLDSGQFGELVSAGIAEQTDGGYQLTDRAAVRQALGVDSDSEFDGETSPRPDTDRRFPSFAVWEALSNRIAIDRRAAVSLLGALFVLALARTVLMWGSVFRNGDIVLAGNDAYLYRYWGETLLASSLPAFDPTALSKLPGTVPNYDTLTIVSVWWLSALLGGDPRAVGLTLAWYPVLAGVATALGCYLVAVWLTGDRRIGIAAVLLLAFTPAHAYRTALGFGDHHAADYVWLMIIVLSVVVLARERISLPFVDTGSATPDPGHRFGLSPNAIAAIGTLAVGLAGQTHAWRAGPLLSIPIGLYVLTQASLDAGHDRSPIESHGLLLVALALGSVLSAVPHFLWGWAPVFQAFAPTLLTVGTLGVIVIGELCRRFGLSARATAGVTTATIGPSAAVLVASVPTVSGAFDTAIGYFVQSGRSEIAETYSIFAAEQGSLFAPILLFGFVLFLALPYLIWALWRGQEADRPDWVAVATFGWYFFLLSVVQSRFAGELSLFTAVFGGIGFVHLAAIIDATDRPDIFGDRERATPNDAVSGTISLPEATTVGVLFTLFLLVSGLGVIQTGVKQSHVSIDDGTYQTATWIDGYAAQQEQTYPENYVLSPWGINRVFNYFVSGESQSYTFARDNYERLMGATNRSEIDRILDRLDTHGTGYVVTRPGVSGASGASVYTRLQDRNGSRGDSVPGLGRFQLIHSGTGTEQKVFAYVPGSRITGSGPANTALSVETRLSVGGDAIQYRRQVRTNEYGDYGVTVPYPGTYTIGDRRVAVAEGAPRNGSYTGSYLGHYSFDEAEGRTVRDPVGGTNGTVYGAEWVDGPRGSALSFDASSGDSVVIESPRPQLQGTEQFTVCTRAKPDSTTAGPQDIVNIGGFDALIAWGGEAGWEVYFRNATGSYSVTATPDEPTQWTTVCGRYTGTTLELWIDGSMVASRSASGPVGREGGTTSIGSFANRSRYFDGSIDDIRIYRTALTDSRLRNLSRSPDL